MNNFIPLLKGELQRLQKYHIISASVLVALLWIGVLYLTQIEDIQNIFPLLIFIDVTSMAILLIGVTIFFEKQEGTLKTLLISPITKTEFITAKTAANISCNILTLVLLYLYAFVFRNLQVNFLYILFVVILISFFHSLVGFFLSFFARDFTDLLINMMKYFLALMLPVVLEMIGLISSTFFSNLLFILPTKAAMTLLMSTSSDLPLTEILFSLFYLLLLTFILIRLVFIHFDKFAAKESGV